MGQEAESGLIGSDFAIFDYDGFCERGLSSRLRPFVRGRWTEKSLYQLYLSGLDAGSLEMALNSMGLLTDDLTSEEASCANRAYLMARAKTLAEVKGKLIGTGDQLMAKEAEVLLTKVYGINEAEGRVLGGGLNVTIMNQPTTSPEIEVLEVDDDYGEE